MPVQAQYLAYVLEQLAGVPGLRSNRMFGGIGLYSDGVFFGLIDDDTLYFKTGPANLAQYQARNMPKFMPFPDKTGAVMGYHQVPADIIEDPESLVAWARQSVAVQLSAKASVAAKPKKKVKKSAAKPATKAPRMKTGRSARRKATLSMSSRKPAKEKAASGRSARKRNTSARRK